MTIKELKVAIENVRDENTKVIVFCSQCATEGYTDDGNMEATTAGLDELDLTIFDKPETVFVINT